MQRKNNILKSSRNGMAMIMAIAVIVIMSTIMALSLSMTSQTTKRTVDLYVYEQAVLLSKSATEYALLQIAESAPCTVTNLNFTQDIIYNVNIDISYVFTAPSSCAALYATVTTEEQNGSALMDVTVSVNDPTVISEPIRFFRRSIQKL